LLLQQGVSSIVADPTKSTQDLLAVQEAAKDAYVLVSYPPDGISDRVFANLCKDAKRIVYVSSTGVYGSLSGVIDEKSKVDANAENKLRLEAEEIWRKAGAVILRAPGLYGPTSGLHQRLIAGLYRLPGKGDNYTSRIHVDDLAAIIEGCFVQDLKLDTYPIGDARPTTQLEVVTWLCEQLKLPIPDSIPLEKAPPTLRGNRKIDGSQIIKELGIKLKYPTYKDGFADLV
jgi:nucleoside-diphosphate-sugar epimerase